MNRKTLFVAALIAGALTGPAARGASIATFPGCGTTVQECIDDAAPGDTVRLATSTHIAEDLKILDKSLRLEAAAGYAPEISRVSAFGGDAPTVVAIHGLAIAGSIVAGPGKGDMQLEITGNHIHLADMYGAGIDIRSGSSGPYGDLTVTVEGNVVEMTGTGGSAQCAGISLGAVYGDGETHARIERNWLTVSKCGQGAAIRAHAHPEESLDVAILSNRVAAAGTGAGISVTGCRAGVTAMVLGNEVVGTKLYAGGSGGIVANAGGTGEKLEVSIVNNTVAFNEFGLYVGGRADLGAVLSGAVVNNIVTESAVGVYIDDDFAQDVGALDNLVFHNTQEHFTGIGTIVADPLFVAAPGDLRLKLASPAVNSGDNTFVPPALATDLAGMPRIAGGVVDRGAWEYPGPFPPAAPSDLAAAGVSASTVSLDWTDNSSDEERFVIERWDGNAFVKAGEVEKDKTHALIGALQPDTAYIFRVVARNAAGASAPSNEATAETWPRQPSSPIELTATLEGADRARLDWIDRSDDEEGFIVEKRTISGAFVLVATAPADSRTATIAGLRAGTRHAFRVRARNEGGISEPSNVAEVVTPARCTGGGDTVACLNDDRFAVSAEWSTLAGETGVARIRSLTGDTASFWFFDPENVELVVKVLDGCGVNQRFWVFGAGLTDVAVRIHVTDTWSGLSTHYENPAGRAFEAIQDTGALAVCGSVPPGPPAPPAQAEATDSGCGDGSDGELCIQDGRFRVHALWRTSDGRSGAAHAVAMSEDSGYFWFFDPANVEIVAKVVDACSSFDRFWFFAGGLTDVGVELQVTDTLTGQVRTYRNPLGKAFEPMQDANAFATCR